MFDHEHAIEHVNKYKYLLISSCSWTETAILRAVEFLLIPCRK